MSDTVTTGTAENLTYVNSAAVTVARNRYTATVRKDDGTTETRRLQVGLAGGGAYQIVSGLTVGEKVVLPESTGTTAETRPDLPPGGPPR